MKSRGVPRACYGASDTAVQSYTRACASYECLHSVELDHDVAIVVGAILDLGR